MTNNCSQLSLRFVIDVKFLLPITCVLLWCAAFYGNPVCNWKELFKQLYMTCYLCCLELFVNYVMWVEVVWGGNQADLVHHLMIKTAWIELRPVLVLVCCVSNFSPWKKWCENNNLSVSMTKFKCHNESRCYYKECGITISDSVDSRVFCAVNGNSRESETF